MNTIPEIKYMYENEYKIQMSKLIHEDYENTEDLKMHVYKDCYILPSKKISGMDNPAWGLGGVLVKEKIVDESIIPGAFGGYYEIEKSRCEIIQGRVIHIPIVKDHWGHFLIDVLCRFWFLSIQAYKDVPITCCINLKTEKIGGNFLQVFEMLGIQKRLRIITTPVHCEEVLIPDFSLGFNRNWNKQYLDVINILLSQSKFKRKYTDKKIYLTRTKFLKSRIFEIGEKQIENAFKKVGFEILSPEKMSIAEQIACFQEAKEIASLSGTIPHNIVFAHEGLSYIILNRQPVILLPQLRINQLMNKIKVYYIDVWHPLMKKKPKPYGSGAVWVFISKNLSNYFYEKYSIKIKSTNFLFLLLERLHWYAVNIFDYIRRKK